MNFFFSSWLLENNTKQIFFCLQSNQFNLLWRKDSLNWACNQIQMNQIWLLSAGTGEKWSQGQGVTVKLPSPLGENPIRWLLPPVRLKIKTSKNQHISVPRAAERGDNPPSQWEMCSKSLQMCWPWPTTAQHTCMGKKTQNIAGGKHWRMVEITQLVFF